MFWHAHSRKKNKSTKVVSGIVPFWKVLICTFKVQKCTLVKSYHYAIVKIQFVYILQIVLGTFMACMFYYHACHIMLHLLSTKFAFSEGNSSACKINVQRCSNSRLWAFYITFAQQIWDMGNDGSHFLFLINQ